MYRSGHSTALFMRAEMDRLCNLPNLAGLVKKPERSSSQSEVTYLDHNVTKRDSDIQRSSSPYEPAAKRRKIDMSGARTQSCYKSYLGTSFDVSNCSRRHEVISPISRQESLSGTSMQSSCMSPHSITNQRSKFDTDDHDPFYDTQSRKHAECMSQIDLGTMLHAEYGFEPVSLDSSPVMLHEDSGYAEFETLDDADGPLVSRCELTRHSFYDQRIRFDSVVSPTIGDSPEQFLGCTDINSSTIGSLGSSGSIRLSRVSVSPCSEFWSPSSPSHLELPPSCLPRRTLKDSLRPSTELPDNDDCIPKGRRLGPAVIESGLAVADKDHQMANHSSQHLELYTTQDSSSVLSVGHPFGASPRSLMNGEYSRSSESQIRLCDNYPVMHPPFLVSDNHDMVAAVPGTSPAEEKLLDALHGQLFEGADPWTALDKLLGLDSQSALHCTSNFPPHQSQHSGVQSSPELSIVNDQSGVGYCKDAFASVSEDVGSKNISSIPVVEEESAIPNIKLSEVSRDGIGNGLCTGDSVPPTQALARVLSLAENIASKVIEGMDQVDPTSIREHGETRKLAIAGDVPCHDWRSTQPTLSHDIQDHAPPHSVATTELIAPKARSNLCHGNENEDSGTEAVQLMKAGPSFVVAPSSRLTNTPDVSSFTAVELDGPCLFVDDLCSEENE
ncbi:hypothetical protein AcW1_008240 [Taiwanofungus camphoratus]|nr:hypothetical protein AcV5_008537 [Antrodia cinnamomea]KAI0951118.1 hypothetical protein AcW1_008240 [Antrodia cinnamomea]KAI0956012.1 hypothetical protein AcV7_006526 [Antrodia cinnamomea]